MSEERATFSIREVPPWELEYEALYRRAVAAEERQAAAAEDQARALWVAAALARRTSGTRDHARASQLLSEALARLTPPATATDGGAP